MTRYSPVVLLIGTYLSKYNGTIGIGEQLAYKLPVLGIDVLISSRQKNQIARIADMLGTLFKNYRAVDVVTIDVYSGRSFIYAETVLLAARLLKKPTILVLRGGNLPLLTAQQPFRVRRLLDRAQTTVTPSKYIKSSLSEICDNIHLLPNAIEIGNYPYRLRHNPAPRLAWLRAFHNIYDPVLAAKALALIAKRYPDVRLSMFGPDKNDGSLNAVRTVVTDCGIGEHILIPGPLPKSAVPSQLGSFDIFLNTTTAESFGVSVVEAAALGMCIVTTNVGELPYIWTHDHDALLVPPNDPEAMAAAVRRILTEPGLASRLSQNARQTAEQFDWSAVLPQWESLLLDVIDRHR